MLYNLKIPKETSKNGYFNLLVETKNKIELAKLKELLYKSNINEDLKEDIEFCFDYSIERDCMKDFFIKNNFEIIELESESE